MEHSSYSKYREFVLSCKNKTSTFKEAESEMKEIRKEDEVLVQTINILQGIQMYFMKEVNEVEANRGISGYFQMREEVRKEQQQIDQGIGTTSDSKMNESVRRGSALLDMLQNESKENLTETIKKLSEEIATKRTNMAPVVNDLRPLRVRNTELLNDHKNKKQTYETTAAGLEANLTRLVSDVKKYKEEVSRLESNEFQLKCDFEVVSSYKKWIQDDSKRAMVQVRPGSTSDQDASNDAGDLESKGAVRGPQSEADKGIGIM